MVKGFKAGIKGARLFKRRQRIRDLLIADQLSHRLARCHPGKSINFFWFRPKASALQQMRGAAPVPVTVSDGR